MVRLSKSGVNRQIELDEPMAGLNTSFFSILLQKPGATGHMFCQLVDDLTRRANPTVTF